MGRFGEEEGLRDIERLNRGKYTCFWWVSIRAECVRRSTFLGRVTWWIFSFESDVLYVCGIYNKILLVQFLDLIRFKILTFAVAVRSREKKNMRAQKAPSANQRSNTVR